jgi:hypothetical protein
MAATPQCAATWLELADTSDVMDRHHINGPLEGRLI